MAAIKSYTNLEQSKKLAEILPLESADMHSEAKDIDGDMVFIVVSGLGDKTKSNYGSPVWSLAALLGILPNYQLQTQDDGIGILCSCDGNFNIVTADNPVDACVAMIERLHELNLL